MKIKTIGLNEKSYDHAKKIVKLSEVPTKNERAAIKAVSSDYKAGYHQAIKDAQEQLDKSI